MSMIDADQFIRDNDKMVQAMIFKVESSPHEFARKHGIEYADLEQIGRLALWEGIRTYKKNRGGMTLESYAFYVIRHRLESYVDKLKRYARRNGNYPSSLNKPLESGDEVGDLQPSKVNVEQAAIRRLTLEEATSSFTERQKKIFALRLNGFGYREIADRFGLKSCGDLHVQLERAVKKIDPSFTLKRDVRRGNVEETFVRMYNEGRSKEEIVAALQIKPNTFYAYKGTYRHRLHG